MRRRDKAGGKTLKAQRQTLKRRNTPSSVAPDEVTDVARLTRERDEAREQQTATAEILRVIRTTPTDTQPVFEAIVQSGLKLFPDAAILIVLPDGDKLRAVAFADTDPARAKALLRVWPVPLTREYNHAIAILDRRMIDIPEARDAPSELATGAQYFLTTGYRAITIMPMMRGGDAIGALSVVRAAPGALSDKQIAVLRTFADQAVIAIENTRLLNELRQRTDDLSEALEQQTATSEVLRVISSSPTNVQPVFDSIAESAVRLCDGQFSFVNRFDGKVLDFASCCGLSAEGLDAFHSILPMPASEDTAAGRAIVRRAVVEIPDVEADPSYGARGRGLAKAVTYRSIAAVPLLNEGNPIGAIAVARVNAGSFPKRQIVLLQAFADQAVIAIKNVRLFDEVQARTRQLSESLEQQTATSEVLKIISSSPGDLEPVFNAMLANATRLCEARYGTMWLREGDAFRAASLHGPMPPAYIDLLRSGTLFHAGPDTPTGRVVQTQQPVQVLDLRETRAYLDRDPVVVAAVEVAGIRTVFSVPMLKDDQLVGTISIYRQEILPFTAKQIELVQNFAAQAVIAIENTRLLSELRESLQQQTATADVLKVISSSPGELEPVFNSMLENATKICQAKYGVMFLLENDGFRTRALCGVPPALAEERQRNPVIHPSPKTGVGRVLRTKQTAHIADVLTEPEYVDVPAGFIKPGIVQFGGARTELAVPMLKDNELVGTIVIYRTEVRPFTDKQIELVTNFAAQAVIAIENTRLLNELRTRTNELAQSVGELQALGEVSQAVNSTLDLETVLTTIVGRAVQLSRTDAGAIYVFDEGRKEFRLHATYGMSEAMIAAISDQHIGLGDSNIGAATAQRKPIQVPDIRNQPSPVNEIILREGYRGILVIPLLRPDHIVGALVVRRKTPGEFPQSAIELLQTFADQSVVAIQNARLFESVEKSLEDLRTAQDRLVQTEKLASLGQLTAGIAHEIKNPLNFVNNFSGVSAELIDELQDALNRISIDHKARAEIKELTDTLRGNLDKVVQHGKRADAIVKNMLLHSRAGSGEHRPVDINAVVEESLNLAWHGARAEKQGFNITLEKSFDPTAGEADVFPQDITRVLLNLISNGFYAATKRRAETNGGEYEPTLAAATRSLGDRVEITIRDNGTGIPPDVKEKMFNPFFTTKPAGEGTGLGLSISHDIIVKQHGGSIEVDTQPGEFSEFRIILPRVAVFHAESGGRV